MKKSPVLEKFNEAFLFCLGIFSVVFIWWLIVRFTRIGLIIPSPLAVLRRLIFTLSHPIGRQYTLPMHLLFSLKRVVTGFCLAVTAGVILGIAMGRFKMIEAVARPLFELVRPIPAVAWIPLAIVWFGIGETAKIYLIFMAGFVNIVVNTYSGAHQVDENIMGAAYMLGANEVQAFFRVVIPSCIPYIFSGMQVGLSTCWMAVLAAEMISAKEGIGWTITAGQEAGDMTQIFVGVIAIAVTGLLLAIIMRWAEKILCSWRVRGT
jgi:NitT/TauT family transport system permease protein/sulfonate transport system permease protein